MQNSKFLFSFFLETLGLSRSPSKFSDTRNKTLNSLRALAGRSSALDTLIVHPGKAQKQYLGALEEDDIIENFPTKQLPLEKYAAHTFGYMLRKFQVFLSSGDQSDAREAFEHALAVARMIGCGPITGRMDRTELFLWIVLAYLADYPQDFPSVLQAVAELGEIVVVFLLGAHGLKTLQDLQHYARSSQHVPLSYAEFLCHLFSVAILDYEGDDEQEAVFLAMLQWFQITPTGFNDVGSFASFSDIRENYYQCMVLHYIFYTRFLVLNNSSDLYESLEYRLSADALFPQPLKYSSGHVDLSFLHTIQLKDKHHNGVRMLFRYYDPDSDVGLELDSSLYIVYHTIICKELQLSEPTIWNGQYYLSLWEEHGYDNRYLEIAVRVFDSLASRQSATDEERRVARWSLAFIRSDPDPRAMRDLSIVTNNSVPWTQYTVAHTTLQWSYAAREGNLMRVAGLLPLLKATAESLDTNSAEFTYIKNLEGWVMEVAGEVNKPERDPKVLESLRRKVMFLSGEQFLADSLEELRKGATSTEENSFTRLGFARDWAQRSFKESLPESVDAFQIYASLLQDNIHMGSTVEHKHRILASEAWLQHWGDAAVSAVVRHGGPDRLSLAVEFLEQSRSITYRHLFQLRQGDSQLSKSHPSLEARWLHLSSEIRDAFQTVARNIHQWSKGELEDFVGGPIRGLEHSHTEILKEIRQKPEFENFLRPLKYDELSKAAFEGPVLLLSSDPQTESSHALIILLGRKQPIHVQLPEQTSSYEISRRSDDLTRLLTRGESLRRRGWERDTKPTDNDSLQFQHLLEWLWDHVVNPVFDALEGAGYTSGRVWWCLSGNFTRLPLHAAAMLDPRHSIISSYTPSLQALIDARRRGPASDDTMMPRHLAAVGLQSCPRHRELQPLYAVNEELQIFFEDGDKHYQTVERKKLEGCDAQVGPVLDAMKSSHIVHLACHGVQDSRDPLNSHLVLYDGELSLRDLMNENLPCAEFAFLSACQTATGHKDLANESVHLAGGFIAAGFKGVVGTLWPIIDQDAPRVVRKVYEGMKTQKGGVDVRGAAEGLHGAVQSMIKRGLSPRRWAPFIHVGL